MHLVRHCTPAWYDTSHTLCLCLCDAGAATPGGVGGEGPGRLAKAVHLLPPIQLQNLPQLVHHIPEHTQTYKHWSSAAFGNANHAFLWQGAVELHA